MKRILSLCLSISLIISMTSISYADTTSESTSNNAIEGVLSVTSNETATIDGESVLYSYEEDGELYVVTLAAGELPPGGGKCPSRSKTTIQSFSRAELQSLRNRNQLEHGVRTALAGTIAGAYNVGYSIAFSVLGLYSGSLAADCSRILDNTTKSTIYAKAYFTCSSKVQASSWFHIWKLRKVEAV